MKNFIPLILVVFLLALLGCGDQNSVPTSAEQEHDVMSLAKNDKGKDKGDKGEPSPIENCTEEKAPINSVQCPNISETSHKWLKNGVKVTWTSSFSGFEYEMGKDYTVTVEWGTNEGFATRTNFTTKKKTWTPSSKKDEDVAGTACISNPQDNRVDLTVNMSAMHRVDEADWHGYIGNGHFKLILDVTNDEGITVTAKLGVNVHLEDPGPGYSSRCPVD